jgi:hypothetical protein
MLYVFFLKNTPSLFVGQIFICGDHHSLYQYWQFTNCTVELFSSFRSSPVDCSGCTFFSLRGRVELLSCCCDVLCGFSWKDRWRQTSKCDISRWGNSGRGKRKVFVHPAGIEPSISRLWEEDGTTRPSPVHMLYVFPVRSGATKAFEVFAEKKIILMMKKVVALKIKKLVFN